jgi:hypothetical protein
MVGNGVPSWTSNSEKRQLCSFKSPGQAQVTRNKLIPSCSHNHNKKPAWYSTLLGFHNKSKDIIESELNLDLLFGIEEESVEDRGRSSGTLHC